MSELDALYAFLVALAVAALLTPLVARLAVRVGAVDEPRERGLAARSTPLLGGLAILAGTLAAALIWLPVDQQTTGILLGAVLIALVGAADDVRELSPGMKFAGQLVAALIPVLAGVLAAIVAGAALGFLIHNFHPASVFMGDCGALLLGYLLGCAAVQGSLKTNALIALVGPLAILAVPFLDTGFVIARRLKYRRAPWSADAHHFHHRMARIGFSQRRTVLYLYAWTFMLAGLAVAMRFIPYSDNHGRFDTGWSLVMVALALVVLATSVYLVVVLEILKLKRLRAWQLRRADPDTTEHEIVERVERELETGEFPALESQRER